MILKVFILIRPKANFQSSAKVLFDIFTLWYIDLNMRWIFLKSILILIPYFEAFLPEANFEKIFCCSVWSMEVAKSKYLFEFW